jgi:hypothetical protein
MSDNIFYIALRNPAAPDPEGTGPWDYDSDESWISPDSLVKKHVCVSKYDYEDYPYPTETWDFLPFRDEIGRLRWLLDYDADWERDVEHELYGGPPKPLREVTPERVARTLQELGRKLPQILVDHLKERAARKPSPPPAASNWEADDQIIQTLRKAGERLTTAQLHYAMEELGFEASLSTIKLRLAAMVRNKTLTNDPRAKPPGYGLPE